METQGKDFFFHTPGFTYCRLITNALQWLPKGNHPSPHMAPTFCCARRITRCGWAHCCRLSPAIVLLSLLLPGLGAKASGEPGSVPPQPNVLLVVLDDFGFNDLAINNGSDSPTPTLDQLSREGIRFTRHYAESTCSPSRVALLTGMYAARSGAHPGATGIDHALVTLPEKLRRHGYRTHMIGKWHAGATHTSARPEQHGFDQWFGFINQMYLAGPHGQDNYRRNRPTYRNPWLENETGELLQYKGHLTELLTARALEVVARARQPWFLYLSYYAPHTPIQPAEKYAARFPDTASGRYQALKAQLDDSLARILSHLEVTGQRDNTLIVVVSDNGGTTRDWPSNLPYTGTKASYTEGGVRTPLLLSWPGYWPEGAVREEVVAIFDIYPTLVSALDLPAEPGLEGVDLLTPPQPRTLRWYTHHIFGDRYSMLSSDGQWRLTAWEGVSRELHKQEDFVRADATNYFAAEAEIAKDMAGEMENWIRAVTTVDRFHTRYSPPWVEYSGDDFRRTPLAWSHSMGFVFRRGEGSQDSSTLAVQKGYINLGESGGRLNIVVDGTVVEVTTPEADCFTLVIRSLLWKNNMVFLNKNSKSNVSVYLDGKPAGHSVYRNTRLNTASPGNPLQVWADARGQWYMPTDAGVFLSTRALPAKEIEDRVHPALATACPILADR